MRLPLLASAVVAVSNCLPAQVGELLATPQRLEVPDLAATVGHGFGERISNYAETVRYLEALDAASPRVELRRYGESWEGRGLHYLVISAPENLARIDSIRAATASLADPREVAPDAIELAITNTPAITWLAYSVHGDEISCTDAALLLAWHLASASGDELVDQILRETVVIVDPLQNPDGRERFVFNARQTRGRWPDADRHAAERDQPWPGGRTNHALFDMNRDWFAMTQPETRARVRAYQEWWPAVFVDLHEMGGESSYYFGPPALPHNPEMTPGQHEWLDRFGRNNAAWFDRHGFDYFTRESYDAFYPGYGEGWPTFHGSVAMTYEQASVRGLVLDRLDETRMTYHDSVLQHFVASLATCETTAKNRETCLRRFAADRRSAIEEGRTGAIREFVWTPAPDPSSSARLANLLAVQGIEVHRTLESISVAAASPHGGGAAHEQVFPAGSYVVRLDQPAKRLATVLLTRHQDMQAEFIARQRERILRRESAQMYDLTGWSLPLLFGVTCFETGAPTEVSSELLRDATLDEAPIDPAAHTDATRAKVAYLIPAGRNATARALAELLRRGVRVHCAGEPFRIGDHSFAAGTLVVKLRHNDESVHALVHALDRALGLDVLGVDSSWVDEGMHFGSDDARFVKAPRVALAWDRPTNSNSAGAARYLLEWRYGYPVTAIRTARLARADLREFDVIILPDGGSYDEMLGKSAAESIRAWIRAGGTLIALGGGATEWLTGKDVGLLAAASEKRDRPEPEPDPAGKDDADSEPKPDAVADPATDAGPVTTDATGDGATEPGHDVATVEQDPKEVGTSVKPRKPFDYDLAILPEKEAPERTPGAILGVDLDSRHWLAFGSPASISVVSRDRAIYTPIKLDEGRNVGVFAPRETLLRSGFVWEEKLDQLARKAWLVHQPLGDGHVVAFAEDPNVRAFVDGTNLVFLNAVLLGAAF